MQRNQCFAIQFARSLICVRACRWGDAPLRWFELMLFLDLEKDVEVLNISYWHDKVCMREPMLLRWQA
jgi:hypothetical protein